MTPFTFQTKSANNMNNSSEQDNTSAYHFNYSNGMENGGSSYCQDIPAPSASPQGNNDGSQDQQQTGGGSISSNLNAIQSIVQGTQDCRHQTSSTGASSSDNNNSQTAAFWQSCRFCQNKFFVSSERLLEHEISCPMHLQVQQFLQQQQQQNDLQQQLQMQQSQLQQQFNQQQNQFDSSVGSMFGSGGLGQFMSGANNSSGFQASSQASQSQNQDLESLLQQQQQQTSGNANNEQQPYPRANSEDQFESAINNLPDFQNQQAQQQRQAQQQPSQPLSEPKPLTCSPPCSATDYFPLAMPEDEEWLTPLHCFVRKYCVEVFVATPEDVAAPCMGKRNPVSVNQVGIRCPYCSPERMGGGDQIDVTRARENGVVYPSLISRIYNSSINLLQRHLRSCAFVPPEILARYEELKSSNARSGASKKYWADSASRLGLLDTPEGIRLDKEIQRAHRAAQASGEGRKNSSTAASALQGSEAPPLVLPSDKRNTTAFTFHLMSQMQPCVFTEADRLGRRRNLEVGFAGLACRHCFGVYGSGRFFPSSVKTMADASKTLDVIYRHVMKCKNCPCDIKGGLRNLRDFHDSERSKMPFGNQRAFFVKIWGRLHESSPDRVPRALPAVTAPVAAALSATALAAPSDVGVKPHAVPTPTRESLQGLYAMVKRESGCDTEKSHKKLVTEAA